MKKMVLISLLLSSFFAVAQQDKLHPNTSTETKTEPVGTIQKPTQKQLKSVKKMKPTKTPPPTTTPSE